MLPIPAARRVEGQRLLSVVAVPLAAALAMAAAFSMTGPGAEAVAEAGGPLAFVLGFVKICYLAVGMAHLSGALAERFSGGLPAGVWLDEMDGEPRPPRPHGMWETFPNHIDGSVLAHGVALLCWSLG